MNSDMVFGSYRPSQGSQKRQTDGRANCRKGFYNTRCDPTNERAMPRPSKGARLFKRRARYRDGKLVAQPVWIIKDGDRHIATGCPAVASQTKPPREAEQALA